MIVWFYQLILGFNWCRNGIPRIIVRFNAGKTRKSTIYKAPSANVSGKCIVWEEIMEELSAKCTSIGFSDHKKILLNTATRFNS